MKSENEKFTDQYPSQSGDLSFDLNTYTKRCIEITKGNKDPWNDFCGVSYHDPHTLMLKMIYDLLHHIMFKMANSEFDLNTAAFADKGFMLAMEQIEAKRYLLSQKPGRNANEILKNEIIMSKIFQAKKILEDIES